MKISDSFSSSRSFSVGAFAYDNEDDDDFQRRQIGSCLFAKP